MKQILRILIFLLALSQAQGTFAASTEKFLNGQSNRNLDTETVKQTLMDLLDGKTKKECYELICPWVEGTKQRKYCQKSNFGKLLRECEQENLDRYFNEVRDSSPSPVEEDSDDDSDEDAPKVMPIGLEEDSSFFSDKGIRRRSPTHQHEGTEDLSHPEQKSETPDSPSQEEARERDRRSPTKSQKKAFTTDLSRRIQNSPWNLYLTKDNSEVHLQMLVPRSTQPTHEIRDLLEEIEECQRRYSIPTRDHHYLTSNYDISPNIENFKGEIKKKGDHIFRSLKSFLFISLLSTSYKISYLVGYNSFYSPDIYFLGLLSSVYIAYNLYRLPSPPPYIHLYLRFKREKKQLLTYYSATNISSKVMSLIYKDEEINENDLQAFNLALMGRVLKIQGKSVVRPFKNSTPQNEQEALKRLTHWLQCYVG